jgi:hypothetical protein
MNTPRSFGFLTIVFAVVFAIVYAIAMWKNFALFTYHPVPGTITPGVAKSFDGPAMYWFGWMATGLLGALGACLVACALPESISKRVWSGWAWAAPLGVLIFLAFLLRNYFLGD